MEQQMHAGSAATQRQRIIEVLARDGRMSTLDARNNGIMHPAMRVKELRDLGYNIATHWDSQADHADVRHRVAFYVMESNRGKA